MGHPLRWYLPNMMFEITTRTIQERYLLRPSKLGRELIIGVIARAQVHFPSVLVHAFVFMSNHYHLLVTCQEGDELAGFLCYLNGNVARKLGGHHQWRGPFWGRRARAIPVIDDDSQIARLRYILLNGVKEALVRSPRDWPGASAVPGLLGDMKLSGRWVDHDSFRRARQSDPEARQADFTSFPEVHLSPLPVWNRLSGAELRKKHEAMICDVEREAPKRVLGVNRVLALDPFDSPTKRDRETRDRNAPQCHTVFATLRDAFRVLYGNFVQAFRTASKAVASRTMMRLEEFPEGSFPRHAWFRPAAKRGAFRELVIDVMMCPILGWGTRSARARSTIHDEGLSSVASV